MVLAVPAIPSLAASTTYIKAYANMLNAVQYGLTPEDVQATSDGGSIVLAQTQSSSGIDVSWLVKLDPSGDPQWQKEVGCFSLPPRGYAGGVSVQRTTDGELHRRRRDHRLRLEEQLPVIEWDPVCLDREARRGRQTWLGARVRRRIRRDSITQIRLTTDGSYIAVGSATNASQNTGGLDPQA